MKGGEQMLQRYLEEIKKTPLLTQEEEYALWELEKRGDLNAHKKLMTAYQPLVFKIAVGFKLPEDETLEQIFEKITHTFNNETDEVTYDITEGGEIILEVDDTTNIEKISSLSYFYVQRLFQHNFLQGCRVNDIW